MTHIKEDVLPHKAVAIVGIGCRFPGSVDTPDRFWKLLCDGVDAITEMPSERIDLNDLFDPDPAAPGKIYTRWGGFIDQIDAFDADFFGIAPREARRMDPQQRLLLEVAWEALEDAGHPPDLLAGTNVGVFIGISSHDYTDIQVLSHNRHRIDAHLNPGGAMCIAANRISYRLDLRGPSFAVDTACSSSLTAVHLACRSMAAGECDQAIVGGVNVLLAPEPTIGFCRATMLSPDGRCHSFDARANGYVRSEGAGAVILKPLARALSDGDPIYAIIRGSAINQDGRTPGMSLPSAEGQEEMLRQVLREADVPASAVQYVEAHGTGTAVGDPIEARAIGNVFSTGRSGGEPCLIGSVKTNLGHLEAGAGIAGLIKVALALKHRKIPPSLHFSKPNPAIPFQELCLRVPTTLEPWPETIGPAMAGVNSFGFGGANAHVLLEEPPAPEQRRLESDDSSPHVLLLSARSPQALRDLAGLYARQLATDDTTSLHDICYTSAVRRAHHEHRLALVAGSRDEMVEQLEAFVGGEERAGLFVGHCSRNRVPKLAFVFTGMGPQWWKMGRQLMREDRAFRERLEEIDALLRPLAGWSLLEELAADEATSRITEPYITHVANLAIQLGIAALLRSWGIVPDIVIGHSSGEMAAACVAGVLTAPAAVHLAFHRGRLQQRTAGTGRMLAAAISPDEASRLVADLEGKVSIAAFNGPTSITLSGEATALEGLAATFTAEQRFCRFLPIDIPYHGPQMEMIREELLEVLGELNPRPFSIPFISAVTGERAAGPELDAAYWWRNVREPVRFAAAVDKLGMEGYELFVEIGPHPVLAAAITDCFAHHERNATVLPSLRRGEDERRMLLCLLAALHVRGQSVSWSQVVPSGVCVPLPTYPWQRERHWFESEPDEQTMPLRAAGTDSGHPLLGWRLRSPHPVWETALGDARLAYLDEHQVQESVVFPGAGYVEMMLAAARRLWNRVPVAAERIEFRRLLFLPERSMSFLQLLYDPVQDNVEIHAATQKNDPSWTLHATGVLKPLSAGTTEEATDLNEIRDRCATQADLAATYKSFEQFGLRYGAAFLGIRELWLSDGEALGRLALDESLEEHANTYGVHPALLDAAFQVMVSASFGSELRTDGPLVPVSLARIESFGQPGAACWSHAVLTRREGDAIEGNLCLLDDQGRVLLRCQGLRLRAIAGPSQRQDIAGWLYEMHWEEVPPLSRGERSAGSLPAPSMMAAAVREAIEAPDDELRLYSHYEAVEPTLNRIALYYIRTALRKLGWTSDLENLNPTALMGALGVIPQHRRFFTRMIEFLRAEADAAKDSTDDAPDRLALNMLAENREQSAELELFERCGNNLSEILCGEVDPRDVVFGDSFAALTRLYRISPLSRYYNKLVAETVAVAASHQGERSPLRILEIGAGTGGLTSAVLSRLQPATVDYLFTDVSPYFLTHAKEEFKDRPEVRFGILDLEENPLEQQFNPGSFDVVLGANVIHATADIRRTLDHLRKLLTPGGLLVMMELTRKAPWFDLIFGMLEGWWRFADHDLRPNHPLLWQEEWLRPLAETGFEDVAFLADPPRQGGTQQSVILARAPLSTDDATHRRFLLFADRRGVGSRVVAGIRERGDDCILVYQGEGFLRRERDHYEVSTASNDIRQLIESLDAEGGINGVIHLWSLDASVAERTTATEIMEAQRLVCDSTLHLIHALERATVAPTDVWLVTSGSQAVDGEVGSGLAQAPLWGLGRVLRNEQPGLRPRLIDLGPQQPPEEIDALVAELYAGTVAEELALRGQARWVCQMRPAALTETQKEKHFVPVSPDSAAFRLEIRTPGALDTLELAETPLPSPAPGHVSIRVLAAGLIFRDIMLALGILPSSADESGMETGIFSIECAGVVLSCGEGVEAFRPGDEVIALAIGVLGSQAIAREELVVHKPRNLSFEEATCIPSVYLTARYGLIELARMTAGERVLIHSASGGVGHAAIQLCQRAGAEIYATAGTPEKRAYLQSLGIEHVMDSRSLAWAEEVLERTDGEGVDVVLNSLAGEAIPKGLSVLRPFGRFVEIGKQDIYADARLGLLPFRKNLAFFSVDLIRLGNERPAEAGTMLRDLVAQVADGTLAVPPHTEFDVAQAEQAFRLMSQARHVGRVVLTVRQPEYAIRPLVEHSLFRPDATYLITGGTGGFGLAVASWMVREGARHLVLMSRSGMPKDNEQVLRQLESSAATVQVVRGDVACEEEVARTLAAIHDEMPPLRGIMHLAMVLDDAMLGQLDVERFRTVLRPKMAGAWNLHRLTAGHTLDHFVLFSSICSVIGHPLQGNYAAANTFLDALAAYRRAKGLPGVAIGWGTVAELGYVSRHEAIQQHFSRLGIGSFAPGEALTALEYALRQERPHLIAARLEWSLLQKWSRTATALDEHGKLTEEVSVGATGEQAGILTRLRDTAQAERSALLEAYLLKQVAKVLGSTPQRVDPERSLTEMGLDSLLAVELLTALKLDLGVQLPVVKLLQGISSRELAVLILEGLSLGDPAVPQAAVSAMVSPTNQTDASPAATALSFEQRRFWYLEKLTGGNPAYHLFAAARLQGPLDVEALARSVAEVVRRHELLRAGFTAAEGEPLQIIAPPMPIPLSKHDLRHLPAGERPKALQRLATAEIQKPFDLSLPPLLRVLLAQMDEAEHAVLLVVHHIVADAWAVTLLVREVMLLYDAFVHGQPSPLPAPTARYEDYVRWQREVLREDVAAAQRAYWTQQLGDAPTALPLPADHPRPNEPSFRGGHVPFELTQQLSDALHALSRQEGVTLFMTLLAAFQTLLHRYSGETDVSIGTPVAMRNEPLAEKLIGCCMNTLVLRSDLSGDPSFRELLQRVRETTLGAFSHQDLPFERVVEALQPQRDADRSPLFQAMLILHNLRWPELQMEGLVVQPLEVESGAAVGDLTLLVDTGERLHGTLEYNADLFDAATIARMLNHLQILLENIVTGPDRRLSMLPLLSDEEEHRILVEWNQTSVDFGKEQGLHTLFEAQVERTPDAVAVVSGKEHLTYQELDLRANRLARHLLELGVGPDVVVGLCVESSPEMIVGMLGILKAGGAYLPLDPSYPRARLGFMVRDAQVPVLLTLQRLVNALPDHGARVVLLDANPEALDAESNRRPASSVTADSLAYVIYTSGSTGDPKGVSITHRAICNQVHGRQKAFPLGQFDIVLQRTPLSFDPAVWEFAGPLSAGARLVVPPAGDERDSASLVRLISDHQVTVLQIVPSLLSMLLEEPEVEACRCLRHVFCGGEPLTAQLRDRFFEHLPDVELHNLYGPTEAAIDATCWTCRKNSEAMTVPIGRPVANVQVYLLDAHQQPVPVGVPGELYIGGPGLARGYLNRPVLTAEKFVPHSFSDTTGALLYRTGDLARWLPDGSIAWLGRMDGQVKIRGYRVEPEEIAALLMRHPAVREVVVVDREDVPGDVRLVAYVVTENEQDVDIDTLRTYVSDRLPEYMVPSGFAITQALPRLPNGKVDRRALTAADQDLSRHTRTYVAPRDAVEFQLVTIWETVFQNGPVGVRDNFFELGGHSLLAMRLMARVRQTFKQELPLSSLVKTGTVEHLAGLLRRATGPDFRSPIIALRPEGSGPPFFCVHPSNGSVLCYMDLARSLGDEQPFYALQAPALDGKKDPAVRIEDMAAEYLRAVQTVQGAGPYFLGGWSMGSVVAYEMACQLQAQGKQVALLALLDPPPSATMSNGKAHDAARLISFAASIGLAPDHLASVMEHFGQLDPDERLEYVLDQARYADLIPADLALPQLRRFLHVHTAHMEALRRYRPQPYAGQITLFRATNASDADTPQTDESWKQLAAGDVVRYTIPGDHYSMLRDPGVHVLARQLKSLLKHFTVDAR